MKPGLQDVNQINEGTGVHWEAIICYGLAILIIITISTLITIWLLEYIEKRRNKHHDKEDDYDKHVKNVKLDIDCIKKAIERARKLDVENCEWPQTKGSTLYRLVEKLLPDE